MYSRVIFLTHALVLCEGFIKGIFEQVCFFLLKVVAFKLDKLRNLMPNLNLNLNSPFSLLGWEWKTL